jgi:membrane-bound serine protease (ClpP class)
MSLIITSSIVLIAISILMVYLGLNAQKNRKSIGSEALIGVEATASNDILPNQTGEVIILGERWRAKSSEVIHRGDTVIIEKVVGLTLYVKKG